MNTSAEPLFRPFHLGSLTLPNRIVMAPMTRSFSPGGVPTADVAAYYRRRAEGGVGLIVTEGTVIDHRAAANDPNVPRFHGEDALAGWARVVDEVHAAGGKIAPQLWHVGTMRKPGDLPNPGVEPVGPSGLFKPERPHGRALPEPEVAAIVDAFATAAATARRLKFDAIELHGAHGYLIDQFFWDGTNRREDRYGGDLVMRTRFAADVVRACRAAVGPDFPIIFRFSQWKQQDFAARLAPTPDQLLSFLEPLVDAGVDIFHCSTRRFWEPEFEGSDLNLAGWTRKLTGRATITVGSVSLDEDFFAAFRGKPAGVAGIDRLLEMMAAEQMDLVAVGRALLVDADWAAKVRAGRLDRLNPFDPAKLKSLD